MSFGAILSEVAEREKRLVVYAPDSSGMDLSKKLTTRNMTVDHRRVPSISADAFVVIRDGERFYGAIPLVDLLEFLAPGPNLLEHDHSYVYDLLDDTVFVSLDRAQLLATSRELEDRAWRTGRGRLHVGFQRVEALRPQVTVYREMATLDIDIHVYVPGDGTGTGSGTGPRSLFADTPVAVHTESDCQLQQYWFILFDDGADGSQNCALIAREEAEGSYRGVWTYDRELVSQAFDAVE